MAFYNVYVSVLRVYIYIYKGLNCLVTILLFIAVLYQESYQIWVHGSSGEEIERPSSTPYKCPKQGELTVDILNKQYTVDNRLSPNCMVWMVQTNLTSTLWTTNRVQTVLSHWYRTLKVHQSVVKAVNSWKSGGLQFQRESVCVCKR